MTDWQPIETCPYDEDVLFYQPGRQLGDSGYWTSPIQCVGYRKKNPGFKEFETSHVSGHDLDEELDQPTHWMPLPETPKPLEPEDQFPDNSSGS